MNVISMAGHDNPPLNHWHMPLEVAAAEPLHPNYAFDSVRVVNPKFSPRSSPSRQPCDPETALATHNKAVFEHVFSSLREEPMRLSSRTCHVVSRSTDLVSRISDILCLRVVGHQLFHASRDAVSFAGLSVKGTSRSRICS